VLFTFRLRCWQKAERPVPSGSARWKGPTAIPAQSQPGPEAFQLPEHTAGIALSAWSTSGRAVAVAAFDPLAVDLRLI
jgi:hypothetical protein